MLCAGNDQVLKFLEDVYAELIEIFPSEYIHVGGDECPKVRWEKCPKCQARIKALGLKSDDKHSKEERLQSFVINHIEKFLNDHGRQIIGWDEILEGGRAPNATVMSWRGERGGIEAELVVICRLKEYIATNLCRLPLLRKNKNILRVCKLISGLNIFLLSLMRNIWYCLVGLHCVKSSGLLPTRRTQLIKWYDAEGYNYAKHVFNVTAEYTPNPADGTLDITLSTIDNAPIHYTLDGTEPTAASPLYEGVLKIKENADFSAIAVRPTGNSRVISEKINFSKSSMKPIVANQPVNKQYMFKGESTLVDGLKGNGNYKTGRWIAFYKNDMDMTIDLQQPTEISSVAISTCVEKGDWVFDARGFSVEVSDDGKNFTKVASEEYPAMEQSDKNGIYEHKLSFTPVKTQYVKVVALSESKIPEWHGGKGNPAFLFVDEITVD